MFLPNKYIGKYIGIQQKMRRITQPLDVIVFFVSCSKLTFNHSTILQL